MPSATPARSGRWNPGPAPSFTSRSSIRYAVHPVAVRALDRKLLEACVRAEALDRGHAPPRPVRTKLPREHVVGERNVQDLLQAVPQPGAGDRDDGLDPPLRASRHQVGPAEGAPGSASV